MWYPVDHYFSKDHYFPSESKGGGEQEPSIFDNIPKLIEGVQKFANVPDDIPYNVAHEILYADILGTPTPEPSGTPPVKHYAAPVPTPAAPVPTPAAPVVPAWAWKLAPSDQGIKSKAPTVLQLTI